jgi:hypothetical protein
MGDWGLGIGDWGLGIGDGDWGPIPNPQSPIPIFINLLIKFFIFFYLNYINENIFFYFSPIFIIFIEQLLRKNSTEILSMSNI